MLLFGKNKGADLCSTLGDEQMICVLAWGTNCPHPCAGGRCGKGHPFPPRGSQGITTGNVGYFT